MTPEALEEWQQHPVSLEIRAALRDMLDRQRTAAERAYWAGRAWPEADRLSLIRAEALWEDIFDATADEFNEAMKADDSRDGIQRPDFTG